MKQKEPRKNPCPMRCPQQNPGAPSVARAGPVPGADGPSSHNASPADISSSAAVISTEHPCFNLDRWWLARVEGNKRKIAVAGVFMRYLIKRNKEAVIFPAAPIAKRHDPCILETEDGTVVIISGIFDIETTLGNGFTDEACKKFLLGFPECWENWNVLYPEMVKSHTESQAKSSGTSDFHDDSSKFYLKVFQIGKFADSLYRALNNEKDYLGNGVAFPYSSRLPNGAPRFEEYNCGDNGPTVEKSDASNHDSNKVKNKETDLVGASTLKESSHDGIDRTAPSASTGECSNVEVYVAIGNSSRMNNGCQKTHVASMKTQDCLKKPQHVSSRELVSSEDTPTLAYASASVQSSKKSKQPAGTSRKRTMKNSAASNHDNYKVANIETDGREKTHVASLKRRGCLKKPKHAIEDAPTSMKDGSISAIIGLSPPPKGLLTYVQSSKKSKQPASTSRKRTIKNSAASNHENYKVANIETDGREKTHVASLKRRGCVKKPKCASEDAPTSMKLLRDRHMGNLSPLPHGRPKSLSMSTPESLKLKKTRSGRVVVPALDSGCQNIVYTPDGSISAIIGLSPPPKGLSGSLVSYRSSTKDYARKKKRAN